MTKDPVLEKLKEEVQDEAIDYRTLKSSEGIQLERPEALQLKILLYIAEKLHQIERSLPADTGD